MKKNNLEEAIKSLSEKYDIEKYDLYDLLAYKNREYDDKQNNYEGKGLKILTRYLKITNGDLL